MQTYTVTVTRMVSNSAPTFSSNTATRTLPENSSGWHERRRLRSWPRTATSDTLTYTLTGTDADSFEIDSNGQLKTSAGVAHNFDFESMKKSYAVTVSVHDGKDSAGNTDTTIDATIDVTIDLTNVNEAPSVHGLHPLQGENREMFQRPSAPTWRPTRTRRPRSRGRWKATT